MNRLLPVALAAVLSASGPVRGEDRPAPLDALRGTWVCIESAGRKPTRDYRLIITRDGGYRMGGTAGELSDIAEQAGAEGTIRIDAKANPPQLRLVGSRLTVPGLYKTEGTRLTLLLNPEGRQPTSWDKPDGIIHVFVKEEEKK